MQHHLIGPLPDNLIIVAVAGAVALACFVAIVWMRKAGRRGTSNAPPLLRNR